MAVGLTPPAVFVVDSEVRLLPTLVAVSEAPELVVVIVVATIEVSGVLVLTVIVPVSVGVDVSEVGMVKPEVRERESVVRGSEAMRLAGFWRWWGLLLPSCRFCRMLKARILGNKGRVVRIARFSFMAAVPSFSSSFFFCWIGR